MVEVGPLVLPPDRDGRAFVVPWRGFARWGVNLTLASLLWACSPGESPSSVEVRPAPGCGDGVQDSDEECDDGGVEEEVTTLRTVEAAFEVEGDDRDAKAKVRFATGVEKRIFSRFLTPVT